MNRSHAFAGLLASILAFPAGTTASAQVYKWVDERGQVNYSNQLPADPKLAARAAAVEDRVSVYTPDPVLVSEIEANRQRIRQAAAEKPEAWRPAVVMLGTPAPAPSIAYEAYAVDYPYWFGGGYYPHRPRSMHTIPQVKLPPGAIAGNTVGLYSIMPGSSSPVPGTWSPTAPQPAAHRTQRPGPRHSSER